MAENGLELAFLEISIFRRICARTFDDRLATIVRLDLDGRRRYIVFGAKIGEDGGSTQSEKKNKDCQPNAPPVDTPMIEMQGGIRRGIHGKKRVRAVGIGDYIIKRFRSTERY